MYTIITISISRKIVSLEILKRSRSPALLAVLSYVDIGAVPTAVDYDYFSVNKIMIDSLSVR